MSATRDVAALAALEDRDVRALTRPMTVLDDAAPAPADAPGMYHVTTASGESYVVDARLGACECPDAQFRDPEGGCQHVRRVAFEIGAREIPAGIDRDAVDDLFRAFVTPAEGER
jgi:hypothetical protein